MRLTMFILTALLSSPAAAQSSDIIVTGEKRPVGLQQTPTSIALYTAEQIERRAIRDTSELYDRTPNVAPAFGGSGFSIRGITNIGVTGGGEASTATIYLDGIPLPSTFLQAAPLQLWDAAQVEILRGPQSTLQGINALAGAFIIKSQEPSFDDWHSRGRLLFTNETQSRLSLAAGGPISGDELAVRFSADIQNRDGTIWNVTRQTSEASERSMALRGKIAWRPQNWDGFEARLGYLHAERKGPYYTVYARTDVPDFQHNRIATDNIPNTTSLRFDGATLDLRYAISNQLTLVSEGSWSHARETSQFDGDYGPANLAYASQQRRYQTITQELRLVALAPRFQGVAGFYFFDRDLQSSTSSRTSVPTPVPTIAAFLRGSGASASMANAIAASYGADLPSISVDFAGAFPTKVRTYAVFGDARLEITSSLALLLGVRAEREISDTRTDQRSAFAGAYPDPLRFGPLAPVISQINAAVGGLVSQANAMLPVAHRRFDILLPKVGLSIGLSPSIETFLVVQKSYRSGGTSGNIARGQAYGYDPEGAWNYEAALRSRLFNDRLRLNANLFYVDWTRQQVALNFGLNAYDVHTVNAGRSHLYGLEMDATYSIRPSWNANISVGHVRTKFDEFVTSGLGMINSLSGSEFAFAPRWTATAGSDFRVSSGWGGSIDASYASRSFGAPGLGQASNRISPHTIANFRFGYQARGWSAHLTGSNILDTRYIAYKSPAENRAVVNAPRIIGIELTAHY